MPYLVHSTKLKYNIGLDAFRKFVYPYKPKALKIFGRDEAVARLWFGVSP